MGVMRNAKTKLTEIQGLTNNESYMFYVNRLRELSLSMFEWKNLPDTCDMRYIETCLFLNGNVVFFEDEVMGLLALDCIANGNFDVYGYPVKRRAYSVYNNYQKELTKDNSVILWNNYLRTNSVEGVMYYAKKLWELDEIIIMNARAQKTPILLQGTEKERLSLLNIYKEYDGNSPVIFGTNSLNLDGVTVLKTDAPYNADKLNELKNAIWNEALTYLGIANMNFVKRERLVSDEVTRSQGGTIASRYSRLESRQKGADEVNKMFGTNIEVEYRDDIQMTDQLALDIEGGTNGNEKGGQSV